MKTPHENFLRTPLHTTLKMRQRSSQHGHKVAYI